MRLAIKPIRDEVFVRVVKEPPLREGIYIPEQYVKPTRQGVVLALGPKCRGDVEVGDTVLLPEFIKSRVVQERIGPEFNLVSEADLIGVVEMED